MTISVFAKHVVDYIFMLWKITNDIPCNTVILEHQKPHVTVWVISLVQYPIAGLILGLRPTNERRRYVVTTSLIGWAQT